MTAQFGFPRFFVTSPSPCPYLPGRDERKVFTELDGDDPVGLNDALGQMGFRRSQNVAYRPSCAGCNACVSVRVRAADFVPGKSQRRTLKRYAGLSVAARAPWATDEQFELLSRYLAARHPDGGMAEMTESDYAQMVEQSPVDTSVVEYRAPGPDGRPGRLVGACLTDRLGDGLSMVYSFFETEDPDYPGLGTFIILDHIHHAAQAQLSHVYLGYWIAGSERMAYKTRFRPIERLGAEGWGEFDPDNMGCFATGDGDIEKSQGL